MIVSSQSMIVHFLSITCFFCSDTCGAAAVFCFLFRFPFSFLWPTFHQRHLFFYSFVPSFLPSCFSCFFSLAFNAVLLYREMCCSGLALLGLVVCNWNERPHRATYQRQTAYSRAFPGAFARAFFAWIRLSWREEGKLRPCWRAGRPLVAGR